MNQNLEKSTELSKFVWELKRKEKEFEIYWEIVRQAQAYKPGNKFCNLCTSGFPKHICMGAEEERKRV